MDTEGFWNAMHSYAYQQWVKDHGENPFRDQEVLQLIKSEDFQNWSKQNPRGTVEQYLSYKERLNSIYNSEPYITLQNEYENLVQQNQQLKETILEINDNLETTQTCNKVLLASAILLLIAVIFIGIKLYKKR